jgi:2-polyprenyl-3-methyl-5-hydroxy-6-metoxy-1,4-benzoquinol methylase
MGEWLMNKIDYIREEEKKYHEHCYDNYKLFEEGSWLHKPVKTVMDLFTYFDGKPELRVLDLGCGIGRNSFRWRRK